MMTTPKGTAEHPKIPTSITKEMWALHVDGASNKDGLGAGIVLASPYGDRSTYALRFKFKGLNNEAEYEALLAWLWLAISMNVTHLEVFSDSKPN